MPRHAEPPKLERDRKGSGIWYIYVRENGRQREYSARTRDPGEAEAYFADWLRRRELRAGPRDPSQVAIRDCLMEYAEKRAPNVAAPWRVAIAIERLTPFWGTLAVASITRETSGRYVKHRMGEIAAKRKEGQRKPAEATARRELAVLNAAVSWCAKEGVLTYARSAALPAHSPGKERWLTRPEAARLLAAARGKKRLRHVADFIRLGLRHGARKEAVLAVGFLRGTAGGFVDLENGEIDFNPSGPRGRKKPRARAPLAPRTRVWLEAVAKRRRSARVVEWAGKPVRDIKKGFAEAARLAGLEGITPHALRHTAVTWLLKDGVPPWEVAGYVGMSEEMVKRRYGHHHPDHMERAKKAMGR